MTPRNHTLNAANNTPRTDEMLSLDAGGPGTVNGALVLYRAIALCCELERELRIAKCALHDCCMGKPERGECAWYE